jgi:uncharacterized membrane protein
MNTKESTLTVNAYNPLTSWLSAILLVIFSAKAFAQADPRRQLPDRALAKTSPALFDRLFELGRDGVMIQFATTPVDAMLSVSNSSRDEQLRSVQDEVKTRSYYRT